MIVIKLAFYPMLFLGLVIAIAVPWVALVAFIALVVYGVTDTARKVTRTARQPEQAPQEKLAIAESNARRAEERAISKAEAGYGGVLTSEAIRMLCNPN